MDFPETLNIAERFLDARVREGKGDKEALRLDQGSLSYRQVQALANRFGNVLRGLGVRREERVLIGLPDGPEFVGALFGILKIGAVAVMVNPNLQPGALGAIFSYSRAPVAVVHDGYLEAFRAAGREADRRPQLAVVETLDLERESAELDTIVTHRDDPAIWLFSGGTTGAPKAVAQTHRSFANTTECYGKRAMGYREDDVTISVPKLYFGYATGSNLFFPFSVGATSVLFPEHPTPEVLFEKIGAHRPTIMVNVPSMINQMVGHPEAARQDLSSLRFATSAGEALPESLHHRWMETFGVELLDGLGTAEMWHIFVSNLPGQIRPGTLGRAVPGFEVKVCDEEGREVGVGEVGRLWVRGESRAIGYWQNMEKTAQAFRGEWFVGGDLVSIDEEGYLTHRGRADDALKVKGKWLRPQEVESCLLDHPAVLECAVVGVDDEDGLTKPYAFVVAHQAGPELEEELKQHALASLEPYKHPRKVVFVDGLPQTHLGKVDRGKLRELAG